MATLAMILMVPLAACGPPIVYTRTVFQHNVGYNHEGAVRYLVSNNQGPDHIFLQELCEAPANELKPFLEAHGYAVATYRPNGHNSPHCDGPFWADDPAARQIVASKNSTIYNSSFGGPFPSHIQEPGKVNGYMCARFVRSGRMERLCTVHLESGIESTNIEQGLYLLDALTPFLSYPTTVGGDFNRMPHQSPVAFHWTEWFRDIDPAQKRPTFLNDGSPGRKYDYVFTEPSRTSAQPGGTSVGCLDTSSDHCYLKGTVQYH